jgi:hypothetical protein
VNIYANDQRTERVKSLALRILLPHLRILSTQDLGVEITVVYGYGGGLDGGKDI